MDVNQTLFINCLLSDMGYVITFSAIPKLKDWFLKKAWGIDVNKRTKDKLPEGMGLISGLAFLVIMFLFIFIRCIQYWTTNTEVPSPYNQFVELVAALIPIVGMLMLGYYDDRREAKWCHKLFFSSIASFCLLIVYCVTDNGTTVIIPKPFRYMFGNDVWLGPLYYVYMGMLIVFCTNAINIYAGINGLEVGQTIVIGASIIIFNINELGEDCWKAHLFSLCLMQPFLLCALALLYYNWYPASVFVGDTFCYFAGMTFAVVGILGHFSETMLLFFLPQLINFLFSCPQLFHFIPCPRHRLPRYNRELDIMETSTVIFSKKSLSFLGRLSLSVARTFRLVNYVETVKDGELQSECTNFTLINYILKVAGPTHERKLTVNLMAIQVLCSCMAFCVIYGFPGTFYDI